MYRLAEVVNGIIGLMLKASGHRERGVGQSWMMAAGLEGDEGQFRMKAVS